MAKDAAFSRSVVDVAAVDTWRDQPGVKEAGPFGNALVNARSDRGVDIDLALFGVEVGGFLDPEVVAGGRLGGEGEAVISATAHEEGVDVGDTLVLAPAGTELTVVGVLADQHTFGHVDVAYVALPSWQEAKAGVRAGDVVPGHIYDEITAVAVRAGDGTTVSLAAGDRAARTTSMTLDESYGASPGYTAETSTLQLIQGFLYAISALVVGAFFTVLTVQRRQEVAVLRAMGASTGYLMRDSLLQSLVLLAASALTGVAIGVAAGAAIASTPMPFALEAAPIAGATVLLITLGMAGAAVAVLRITRVDPLTALGGNR